MIENHRDVLNNMSILSVVLKKHLQGTKLKTPVAWQVLKLPKICWHWQSICWNWKPGFISHSWIPRLSSMVLHKVSLTEDSLFDPTTLEVSKALHKDWLLKKPIAERDSMSVNVLKWFHSGWRACLNEGDAVHACGTHVLYTLSLVYRKAKWEVPSGRSKRCWFVLTSTSDKNM